MNANCISYHRMVRYRFQGLLIIKGQHIGNCYLGEESCCTRIIVELFQWWSHCVDNSRDLCLSYLATAWITDESERLRIYPTIVPSAHPPDEPWIWYLWTHHTLPGSYLTPHSCWMGYSWACCCLHPPLYAPTWSQWSWFMGWWYACQAYTIEIVCIYQIIMKLLLLYNGF